MSGIRIPAVPQLMNSGAVMKLNCPIKGIRRMFCELYSAPYKIKRIYQLFQVACELSNTLTFEEIAGKKIGEKIDKILDTNFSQDKFKENFRENFNKTLTENIDKMLDSNISKELFKEAVDKAISEKVNKADSGKLSFNLSRA